MLAFSSTETAELRLPTRTHKRIVELATAAVVADKTSASVEEALQVLCTTAPSLHTDGAALAAGCVALRNASAPTSTRQTAAKMLGCVTPKGHKEVSSTLIYALRSEDVQESAYHALMAVSSGSADDVGDLIAIVYDSQ